MDTAASGQEVPPLSICVVQIPKGYGYAQTTGKDARELSAELSRRRLENGGPIQPILAVAEGKMAAAAVERLRCTYRIDLERQDSVSLSEEPPPGLEGAGP